MAAALDRTSAALQAPIILMSQNRQAARDRLAAGLDYEVNLKAEIEIVELHEKLDRILGEHLEELLRTQREQLAADPTRSGEQQCTVTWKAPNYDD